MIIVVGYVHVSPADMDGFLADLRALSVTVRKREGCLFYTAAVEDVPAGHLLVVERWDDQEALSAHLGFHEIAAFLKKWTHRMKGEVQKYDAANERPLTS